MHCSIVTEIEHLHRPIQCRQGNGKCFDMSLAHSILNSTILFGIINEILEKIVANFRCQ